MILHQKEDGEPFQTIFNVVASNPFDPPVAVFENVDLIGGHDYEVVVRVVTRAKETSPGGRTSRAAAGS